MKVIKRTVKKLVFFGIFLGLALGVPALPGGQDIDPFYLKLLEGGEKAYLDKNYDEAVQQLEIAAFGLYKNKELRAKAFVYMSLSYYQLKNAANGEEYLKNALALIGKDGLAGLQIPDSAKLDLEKIVRTFKLEISLLQSAPEKKPEQEPAKKQNAPVAGTARLSETPGKTSLKVESAEEFEKLIRENPHQANLYFRLSAFYVNAGNLKAAEKTLESLIVNNPAEVGGYLELAKLNYQERSLKNAEKNLEKFLAYAPNVSYQENAQAEAKSLLILSAYLRGDSHKLQKLLQQFQEISQDEKIDGLPLNPQDKERLRMIWKTYGKT